MRRKPYTETGLARVQCVRCGERASHQWSLRPCARPETRWQAMCWQCDFELNALVLEFLRVKDRDDLLAAYRDRNTR